jgi:hypothetical protein
MWLCDLTLLWRFGIGERYLWVPDMNGDITELLKANQESAEMFNRLLAFQSK